MGHGCKAGRDLHTESQRAHKSLAPNLRRVQTSRHCGDSRACSSARKASAAAQRAQSLSQAQRHARVQQRQVPRRGAPPAPVLKP